MGRNYRANWLDREVVTRGSPGGPTLINLSMTPRCGHFRGNESRAAHTASGFSTSRVVAWGTQGALHAAGILITSARRRKCQPDCSNSRQRHKASEKGEFHGEHSLHSEHRPAPGISRLNSVFQNSQLTVASHGPHRTGGRGRCIPKRAISGRPSRSPRKRWPAPGSSPAPPPTPG